MTSRDLEIECLIRSVPHHILDTINISILSCLGEAIRAYQAIDTLLKDCHRASLLPA